MKAVIFAGGIGSRIMEESEMRPKPMIEIGGRPLLWHVMTIYARHGIKDFVVCLGYKSHMIKEYFINYYLHTSNLTVDLLTGTPVVHGSRSEDWRVTLVDTGAGTQTGGRLKRVEQYLDNETFCATYGDGLADIDIRAEIDFHRRHGKLATMAAIQPKGRFGRLELDGDAVRGFREKPRGEFGWVNGGYFVFEPEVLLKLDPDSGPLEQEFIAGLVDRQQLNAYHHPGFWMSCDTMRDKIELEQIWTAGKAAWLPQQC